MNRSYTSVQGTLNFTANSQRKKRLFYDLSGIEYTICGFLPSFFRLIWNIGKLIFQSNRMTVPISDARESNINFQHQGFNLYYLPSSVSNWHNPKEITDSYIPEITQLIKTIYPDVKKIECTPEPVFRGPNQLPYAGGIHLDYNLGIGDVEKGVWSDTLRELEWDGKSKIVILGIWRPVNMTNPIENNALAVCDASSVKICDIVKADWKGIIPGFISYQAGLCHDVNQKWYYFSRMTNDEVLVFKHFEWDSTNAQHQQRVKAVPHTAFHDPNCPAGVEPRKSTEIRAVLLF